MNSIERIINEKHLTILDRMSYYPSESNNRSTFSNGSRGSFHHQPPPPPPPQAAQQSLYEEQSYYANQRPASRQSLNDNVRRSVPVCFF